MSKERDVPEHVFKRFEAPGETVTVWEGVDAGDSVTIYEVKDGARTGRVYSGVVTLSNAGGMVHVEPAKASGKKKK